MISFWINSLDLFLNSMLYVNIIIPTQIAFISQSIILLRKLKLAFSRVFLHLKPRNINGLRSILSSCYGLSSIRSDCFYRLRHIYITSWRNELARFLIKMTLETRPLFLIRKKIVRTTIKRYYVNLITKRITFQDDWVREKSLDLLKAIHKNINLKKTIHLGSS